MLVYFIVNEATGEPRAIGSADGEGHVCYRNKLDAVLDADGLSDHVGERFVVRGFNVPEEFFHLFGLALV